MAVLLCEHSLLVVHLPGTTQNLKDSLDKVVVFIAECVLVDETRRLHDGFLDRLKDLGMEGEEVNEIEGADSVVLRKKLGPVSREKRLEFSVLVHDSGHEGIRDVECPQSTRMSYMVHGAVVRVVLGDGEALVRGGLGFDQLELDGDFLEKVDDALSCGDGSDIVSQMLGHRGNATDIRFHFARLQIRFCLFIPVSKSSLSIVYIRKIFR